MEINLYNYIEFRKILINQFLENNNTEINYSIDENIQSLEKFFKRKIIENDLIKLKEFEKYVDENSKNKYILYDNGEKILFEDYIKSIKEYINFLWDTDKEEILKCLTKEEKKNLNINELKRTMFRELLLNSNEKIVDIYNYPYNKTEKIILDFNKKIMKKEIENDEE